VIERCRSTLLSEQQSDGGWAQTATRASDAYATGEVLAALNQGSGLTTSHLAYQRGVRYLLNTQKDDGTWFVGSRLHPPGTASPLYFETGLPYGHDQFISAMGTSWATAALLLAIPESGIAPEPVDALGAAAASVPAWTETALFGSIEEMQKLLDSGWDVNATTAGGTTALMMAAPDAGKVSFLLQHGANPNAKSLTRYTALMIAASHHATDSARLLLAHGAEANSADEHPAQFGATPLMLSVFSGDMETMQALSAKGALVETTMLPGGIFPVTPLSIAVMRGDLAMIEALLKAGVLVDEVAAPEDGVTSLGWAVFKNDPQLASLLLSKGADVNHADNMGYTPLLWAASMDFGASTMLQMLLRAGADPEARTKEGLTALQLALKYKNNGHHEVLMKREQVPVAHR
jgi:ankyrin repeat protein